MSNRFACPNCRAEYAIAAPPGNGMVRCKYCQTETPLSQAKNAESAKPTPPSTASVPMLQESMIRKTPVPPPMPTRKPAAETAPTAGATPAARPVVPARSRPGERVDAPSSRRKLYILAGAGTTALFLIVATIFLTRGSGTSNPDPAPGPLTQRRDKDKPLEKPAVTSVEIKDKPIVTPPKEKPIQKTVVENPKEKKDDPPTKSLETLPAQIAPSTTLKVKQSTAYLRVTGQNGEVGEGSGFFAFAPGLVVSNAHVVAMLRAKEKPKEVEVVVHSGEAQEFRRKADVLGVDRDNDLAILRVSGDPAGLPAPLKVEFDSSLAELQKVYIFGFPFGASLGKNITVSESSISSLRKGIDGLKEIQVNGGMHPGNSGGPVVDTRGVVIGVAVAVIRGTQINFAVPGARIRGLLDGRVQDMRFGEPYLADKQAKQAKLSMSIACLDPLTRIKKVRVEVWTGRPGQPRAGTLKTPVALKDDGRRQTFDLAYSDGRAKGEIPLPDIESGQAYWFQPALLNEMDVPQWGTAFALQPTGPPLERAPARLALKYANQQRTIELRCQSQLRITRGSESLTLLDTMATEALETIQMQARGAGIRMQLARCIFSQEVNGRKVSRHPSANTLMQLLPYSYLVSRQGMMIERGEPNVPAGNSDLVREETEDMIHFFSHAYELTALSLPDRQLQPLESWEANLPFLLVSGKKRETAILQLTCVYEGTRTLNKQLHALARLTGEIRTRGNLDAQGRVDGSALINLSAGYVAKIQIGVTREVEKGDALSVNFLDAELSRVEGNPRNILPPPKITATKIDLAGAKSILKSTGVLRATDPVDPRGRVGSHHKVAEVKLAAGKTYVIDLKKTPGSRLDPYLRLENAKGVPLVEDDDSGGQLDARIVHRATAAGIYRIIITSFAPNQLGEYSLAVNELVGD